MISACLEPPVLQRFVDRQTVVGIDAQQLLEKVFGVIAYRLPNGAVKLLGIRHKETRARWH